MNAIRPLPARRWPEGLRWGVCFALALCFHAAGAAALLARWNDDSDLVANAPVIMIELAPVPVAPDITPTEVPPDKVLSTEAEPEPEPPKPVEKLEIPPAPQGEMEMVAAAQAGRKEGREKTETKARQRGGRAERGRAQGRTRRGALTGRLLA